MSKQNLPAVILEVTERARSMSVLKSPSKTLGNNWPGFLDHCKELTIDHCYLLAHFPSSLLAIFLCARFLSKWREIEGRAGKEGEQNINAIDRCSVSDLHISKKHLLSI